MKKHYYLFLILLIVVVYAVDTTSPTWNNQTQNTSITKGGSVLLSTNLSDETALDSAWLSTNETGNWENKTSNILRYYITTDSQSRSSWNETFTGDQNNTFWLNLSKTKGVVTATLNVSSVYKNYTEYQENSNTTTCSGSWYYPCSNTYDGNWDTIGTANANEIVSVFFNYTKKENTKLILWQVKYKFTNPITTNITLPNDCLINNLIELKYTEDSRNSDAFFYCKNETEFKTVLYIDTNYQLYEEAIWWITETNITNPHLDTASSGSPWEWNYTGEFNSSVGSQQVNLNTTLINNYLSSCTADAYGYCQVPIKAHSDTAGILQISTINITTNLTDNIADFYWFNTSIIDAIIGWKIYFNDTSGNINQTDIMTFIVDSVNPSLTLQSPTNSTYNSKNTTTLALNYTASDTNLNTTWYQYNGTNTTLSGNTTFTALDNQQSTLTIYANDTAGNINISTVTFTIDTAPPQYFNLAANSTNIRKNDSVKFSAFWNDSFLGISHYIFSWNDSSVWVNDTAAAFSGNWSNITKQITQNKTINVGWRIYANDTAGNINDTGIQTFTVNNTAPVVSSVIISPSPAQVQDLNCTYAYTDIDSDAESAVWFQWYINGVLNETTQNLSAGNLSLGDNVKCSVKAFDGTDNSTWINSTQLTIGDTTAPSFNSITISPNSGTVNTPFDVFVNMTETNTIDWAYLEIESPNADKINKTMVADSSSNGYKIFNYTYTPIGVGTYRFAVYSQDGSGNLMNYTVSSAYTSNAAVTESGGGGSVTVRNYTGIAIYPLHAELSVFSLGNKSIKIQVKNAQTDDVALKPVATTGKEFVGRIGTGDFYAIKSGETITIDIPLMFDKSGTYLIEFSLSDAAGQPAGQFDVTARVYGQQSYFEKLLKNLQYPLILDPSAEKYTVTESGIRIPSRESTAIPIGIFIGILLLSVFNSLFSSALFLKAAHFRKTKYITEIVFGASLLMTLAIFVMV